MVVERLIPTLRSFNPKLILLSIGLDVLKGDVGNTVGGWVGGKKEEEEVDASSSPPSSSAAGVGVKKEEEGVGGMDLQVEDVGWVTRQVQAIADMCCGGRVVSVLEGGYGKGGDGGWLDREGLGEAAVAHVQALLDPYVEGGEMVDEKGDEKEGVGGGVKEEIGKEVQ